MKKITNVFILILILGGLTAIFSCSDDEEPLSSEKDILSFQAPGQTGTATINASNMTVVAEVECGTDLTNLAPTFTISEGAIASPASGTSGDYNNQVSITVTAEDGSSAGWSVTISEACANATDILTFSFPEETGAADINNDNHTVDIEVENGTDLSALTPTFTLSSGAISDPASGTEGDYSSDVTITVTAQDGTTSQDWMVTVTEAAAEASTDTDILIFLLAEQTSLATIDKTNHTVAIEVVNGTDLMSLTPSFLVSIGATADPESGTEGDYSSDVTITVTAQDGTTTQNWIVTVTEAAAGLSDKTDILSFEIPEQTRDALIDGDNHKITVEVATGTDLTDLIPTWTLSPGATADPESGTEGDYSSDVTITVTAQDGTTTQEWIVEVYIESDEIDALLFCDENLCTNNEELQQECVEFLTSCVESEPEQNHDECIIMALEMCRE